MFRANEQHRQRSLFGVENQLPERKRRKLLNSWAGDFYKEVFCQIHEEDFAVLYVENNGRPNQPVNSLVGATLLQNSKGWSWDELFDRLDFDLLTRHAVGLDGLEDRPFCLATYANFRNRLLLHYNETGENLLETVFDSLTPGQLKRLKVRTDVQRADSFQALSNIASYNRVQLLVEMLIRLNRVLEPSDQEQFKEILAPYTARSSHNYVYGLERSEIPHRLEELAKVYAQLHRQLSGRYADQRVFELFERVWREHFVVSEEGSIGAKAQSDIDPRGLQSPDDLEATFGRKGNKRFKGQVVNVVETAHPDNKTQLITDVDVLDATSDDSDFIAGGAERWKQKTPELNELHTDGAYGSPENDKLLDTEEIAHVQTGVKGLKAKVPIEIDSIEGNEQAYRVSCPNQSVISEPTPTQFKACFDPECCAACTLSDHCQAVQRANGQRTFYFDEAAAQVNIRGRRINSLPPERRKLRPNVEATVKEFTRGFNHKGKLKVRGLFSTLLYAFSAAIMINCGRVARHLTTSTPKTPQSPSIAAPLSCLGDRYVNIFAQGTPARSWWASAFCGA